jgi:hypothetical protein
MSYNSNFTSNFNGYLSSTDILTSVSNTVGPLTTNLNGGGNYYGRYFCFGNLLIQFSDFSSGIDPGSSTEGGYYMYFPYAYDSAPYFVGVLPVKKEIKIFRRVLH